MKIYNFKKRLASAGALAIMSMGGLGIGHSNNMPGNHNYSDFGNGYGRSMQNNEFSYGRYNSRMHGYNNGRYLQHNNYRTDVRVFADRDYLSRHGLYNRYAGLNGGYLPNEFGARDVILVDRDFPNNRIILNNYLTGPYSNNLNQVVVTVSDNFFQGAVSALNTSNNVGINVNTGNNTIILNTVAGNLTTGDVNISVI